MPHELSSTLQLFRREGIVRTEIVKRAKQSDESCTLVESTCESTRGNPSAEFSTCLSCKPGFFGPNCNNTCTCDGDTFCDEGVDGVGFCQCLPGFFGELCSACNCPFLDRCDDLKAGSGACKSCPAGHFGQLCSQCQCAINSLPCDDGVAGTGECPCPDNMVTRITPEGPSCTPNTCSLGNIVNDSLLSATILQCEGTPLGGTCVYSCAEGYAPTGPLVCSSQTGLFNGGPYCQKECIWEQNYGYLQMDSNCSAANLEGEFCYGSCVEGRKSSMDVTTTRLLRTCGPNGIVFGQGECVVPCDISAPHNQLSPGMLYGNDCNGTLVPGETCSARCKMGYLPSRGPLCGNGILQGQEECDDGNNICGDGCSHVCQTETPSYRCPPDANAFEKICMENGHLVSDFTCQPYCDIRQENLSLIFGNRTVEYAETPGNNISVVYMDPSCNGILQPGDYCLATVVCPYENSANGIKFSSNFQCKNGALTPSLETYKECPVVAATDDKIDDSLLILLIVIAVLLLCACCVVIAGIVLVLKTRQAKVCILSTLCG